MTPTPIRIGDTVYPSIRDAAKAIGCHTGTIVKYLDAGRLDELASGTFVNKYASTGYTIRGVTYKSAAEAADALGATVRAIRSAKYAGRLDNVGLPQSQRPHTQKPRRTGIPIKIGPLSFTSQSAAEEALGLSAGYISDVKRRSVGLPHYVIKRAHALAKSQEEQE